jgi:hypothetical protein
VVTSFSIELEGNKISANFPGNRVIEFKNSESARGV